MIYGRTLSGPLDRIVWGLGHRFHDDRLIQRRCCDHVGSQHKYPERIAGLSRIGLDKPIVVQYFDWITGILQGDLGTSIWTGRPVAKNNGNIPTLELTFLSVLFGAGLAVPIGCFMAEAGANRRSAGSRHGNRWSTIPSFWLGIVLIFLLAKLLPGAAMLGYVPFTEDPLGNLQRMISRCLRSHCRCSRTCHGSCGRPC